MSTCRCVAVAAVMTLLGAADATAAEPRADGHELVAIAGSSFVPSGCVTPSHAGAGYGYGPVAAVVFDASVEYASASSSCFDTSSHLDSEIIVMTGLGARLRPLHFGAGDRTATLRHALIIGLQGRLLWAIGTRSDAPAPVGDPEKTGLSAIFLDASVGYEYRVNPFTGRIAAGAWIPLHGFDSVLPMLQGAIGWAF